MTENTRERLIDLYQQMSNLTAPVCGIDCGKFSEFRCCSPEYCEMAMEHASKSWGMILASTGHSKLALMGPLGCVAAPHLRPMCTLHTCDVNSIGCRKNDSMWTRKYFKLRGQIERLEFRREKKGKML